MSGSRGRGAQRAAQMIIAVAIVLAIAVFSLSALSVKAGRSPSGGAAYQQEHRPISCLNVELAEMVNCDAALADVGMNKSTASVAKPVINKHQEE